MEVRRAFVGVVRTLHEIVRLRTCVEKGSICEHAGSSSSSGLRRHWAPWSQPKLMSLGQESCSCEALHEVIPRTTAFDEHTNLMEPTSAQKTSCP